MRTIREIRDVIQTARLEDMPRVGLEIQLDILEHISTLHSLFNRLEQEVYRPMPLAPDSPYIEGPIPKPR